MALISSLAFGFLRAGSNGQFGPLPSQLGTDGTHDNPALNDIDPGDEATQFVCVFAAQAASGALLVRWNNDLSFTGAADGTYPIPYTLLTYAPGTAGVVAYTPTTYTITVGAAVGIDGELSTTLAGVSLAATGALSITGQSATTLAGVTLEATGESVSGAVGSLSATLEGVTLASTGTLALSGSSAVTLGGVSLAATGALALSGALASTLEGVSLQAEGASLDPIAGVLAVTLEGVTLQATNVPENTGRGLEIDWEPNLWWQRKPKKISEPEAREKIAKVAAVVAKKAAKQAADPAPVSERVAEVRKAVAPLIADMPGFAWRPIYDRAYTAALDASIADALQREDAAREAAAREIARIRALDDEDVALLAMML
jgi:hypothetical protein